MRWHVKHARDALEFFNVDLNSGLSPGQIDCLRLEFGLNKIPEKKGPNIFVRYLMQFNDFMIIVLLAAAAVSFFISLAAGHGEFIDSIIILAIVMLNALLGLVQESKAEKSVEALKKLTAPVTTVLRDGKAVTIAAEALVPGDILLVETGEIVPADARLVKSINLKAEESALTGESVPIEKEAGFIAAENAPLGDRRNMLFSGSSITYGRGVAVVTGTGFDTEVGKIAHNIMTGESPDTPLKKKLASTGKMLGIGALIICILVFILGVLRNHDIFEMFMTSVSLAVAAIPEGLPAIVTIMLAMGVQRMSRKNAIVRKLPAVEALGSATVICSDKTGTLTQNKMTVIEIRDFSGEISDYSSEKWDVRSMVLKYAALCNDTIVDISDSSNRLIGDPTETALVAAAFKSGIVKSELEIISPRVNEIPFDSERKLMTTIHRKNDGKYLVITKGAPDFLISKCTKYQNNSEIFAINENSRRIVLSQNEKMAKRSLRVLAVAYKELDQMPFDISPDKIEMDLTFLGLLGMIDPPRPEVKDAVKLCKTAGIKPIMITGDHVITAKAIASELGIMSINERAVSGADIDNMSQSELIDNISKYSVFARVSPEHKVRIVKAFQHRGEVVAMTGDGVNDAPALKGADIGCAMGITGTDVAKGSADMILIDDNFNTIVEAVKEGRGIYANIRKASQFLLSSNIGEIIVMLTALLLGFSPPLLAIHLLWVNLVTDSLPAIALGLDPVDSNVMNAPPVKKHSSLFSGGLWQKIGTQGVMIGLLSLIAFGIGAVYYNEDESYIISRTMAFAVLGISQLVHAFNMRSKGSILLINLLSNKYLIYAFFAGLTLQTFVIMHPTISGIFRVQPLTAVQWLIVAMLSMLPIVIVELEKFAEAKMLRAV